ncbi:hypothetical protein C1646_766168 [Rhizophagus diaphanus]|nr:hypothetical protein C1646_766168 [Rhizophagus diaphanus] [Rhizophagus sp. MUCL 43196]
MEILNKTSKDNPRNLWKGVNFDTTHVTVSTNNSAIKLEEIDDNVIFMNEIEKRKEIYGLCGECNEPGTGEKWCQPSEWPEGMIGRWDTENQKWYRFTSKKVALKSLDNSSDISTDFLNEIKSYLKIYIDDIQYQRLHDGFTILIANGLLSIHNAEKVHKDFHSGNILLDRICPFISDFGMCQPANMKQTVKEEGILWKIPFNNIPHDDFLAIKICKGFRPAISNDKWNDEIKDIEDSEDDEDGKDSEDGEIVEDGKDSEDDGGDGEDGDDGDDVEDGDDVKDSKDIKDSDVKNSENCNNSQNSEIYFQIKECDKIRRIKIN